MSFSFPIEMDVVTLPVVGFTTLRSERELVVALVSLTATDVLPSAAVYGVDELSINVETSVEGGLSLVNGRVELVGEDVRHIRRLSRRGCGGDN